MPSRILLVDSDQRAAAPLEQRLAQAGHNVTCVTTFEAATLQAARGRPDLLVTAVRLGRFNGLHLAVRFRADFPDMPIIVIGDETEVGLAAEAIQLRARFVPKSTAPEQFLKFAEELLSGRAPRDLVSTRRWARRPSEIPAQVAQSTAKVVDVGYGGMRLQSSSPPAKDDKPVDISLPTLGIMVKGVFRWSKPDTNTKTWWYGVELNTETAAARQAWQRALDSLKKP